MTFYEFEEDDIITTHIMTHPYYTVQQNGDQITGSVYLERQYLTTALSQRRRDGLDEKGNLRSRTGPFSSSVQLINADVTGTVVNSFEQQVYGSITNLYDYYSFTNTDYTASFTGSYTPRYRIITIPEIYYDREILSGTFTASDLDSAGDARVLYDNGEGGIYSGTLTGTLVGNIFYSEGLVVLKGGGLNDYANSNEFGVASPTNHYWRVDFKGTHKIPVNIFKCRAPAGDLNATSNPTFYTVPTGSSDDFANKRKIALSESFTYVTAIGIFNDDFEMVALCKLAQPVRKNKDDAVLFRCKIDR